jgi:glycosyltransferase involved in cell wall biosynthesis
MDKKISVIIPIYNAEKYLKQTLNSVRFQTYYNLEIICVLDCPTDNSSVIVDETAKEDNRIKPIRHHKNSGPATARNTGVENASGEYIHFMDADDLICPDFYETLIYAAIQNDADTAACSVFFEKKPSNSIWFKKNEVLSTVADKMNKSIVTIQGWVWRYLIRRSFWNNRNLSFPNLGIMEDKPVTIPMIYYANKLVLCPNAVYFYKYRSDSIVNKNYDISREKQLRDNIREARKLAKEFMRANKIKKPNRLLYRIRKWFT